MEIVDNECMAVNVAALPEMGMSGRQLGMVMLDLVRIGLRPDQRRDDNGHRGDNGKDDRGRRKPERSAGPTRKRIGKQPTCMR